MAEIAAASIEQNSGIEQVNQAILQMDEVTQQNAALVEEAAAIAASVHDQTRKLTEAVEKFKIPGSETIHWEAQAGNLTFNPDDSPVIESNVRLLR
jgi:methyl-accepting chemotaxis protein-1 (serine sensor receptor)